MAKLSVFAAGAGNLWDDTGHYGRTLVGPLRYGALSNNISVNTNLDAIGTWQRKSPFEAWYRGLTGSNIETQIDIGYLGTIAPNPQSVQNSDYFKIITNKNGLPYSSLSDVWINGTQWFLSLSAWSPDSLPTHKAIYAANDTLDASGVEPLPDGIGNRLAGYDGDDLIIGSKGSDIIFGMDGSDYLVAGQGDDIIEGGKGNDFINGDTGADLIKGGLGWNIIQSGVDNVRDMIYVSADSATSREPGTLADIIVDINENDQLFIDGAKDSTLTFVDNVTHPKAGQFNLSAPLYDPLITPIVYSGVGIYSNGLLEAIVTTPGATSSNVDQFTTGIL